MSGEDKYWYNLNTGEVERGFESPSVDRAGPFDTAEEAARAPEILAERSRAWAAEESADDDWGGTGAGASGDDTAR
ncbi:SPOR domain-containing protein [Microbacterium sp. W1N]|uniref:SPOR domain-containing protein n=1 Tax=Microbacterium festucae TaxID=2977531 RepID=UPI0021BECCCE|nr:SPOR domain-containing protein [Microbacterium festucae]MCT9820051.1 SPOR domain-containing protein [Microbacterium festucae]